MTDNSTAELSPREKMLISELEHLLDYARQARSNLNSQRQQLEANESEISTLRRNMIELKEENQHLREVLQTWRQRLDSVLGQLKSLN